MINCCGKLGRQHQRNTVSVDIPNLSPQKNITLWLFNIAMENGPFIDGLPIKN
jgi:hypothetical protein